MIAMYAVIKTGGKQYRVAKDDIIRVEKLDAEIGDQVQFDTVLMLSDGENVTVGTPTVEGGVVSATVTDQARAKKIEIIKFRRRKHHQKRTGHRQYYTEVKITDMGTDGKTSAPPAKAEKKETAPATDKTEQATSGSPFLSAPNGEADDLKQLKGVGPKLEEKLNAVGVFHLQQIADFSQDDLAKVNEQVSFKAEWVEQAKELIG
jgi:large subunit ribosomal protein L21